MTRRLCLYIQSTIGRNDDMGILSKKNLRRALSIGKKLAPVVSVVAPLVLEQVAKRKAKKAQQFSGPSLPPKT